MFFIEAEVQARELERGLLLGMLVAREGHDAFISPTPIKVLQASGSAGHVLHVNSLTSSRLDAYGQVQERGNLITSQDEEAILNGTHDETAIGYANRASSRASGIVQHVYSWGPVDHQAMIQVASEMQDVLVPTGGARGDFWRADMDDFYRPRRPWIPNEPYVLIASRFGRALQERRAWEHFVSRKRHRYGAETLWFQGLSEDWRALGHLVAAVQLMAQRNPNTRFIVRPHPVESAAAWPAFVEGMPNVEVRREGSVGHWVKHAEAVVTMGDMVTYEAVAMQVPTLTFLPDSFAEGSLPSAFGTRVNTVSDLVDLISGVVAGERLEHVQRSDLDTIFWPRGGVQRASERIAAQWLDAVADPVSGPARKRALKAIYRHVRRTYARKRRRRMKAIAGKNPKFPPLERHSVAEAMSGLDRVVEHDGVGCRLVTPSTVHVFASDRP